MAIWFLRGLRRGVVTTHYPARPTSSARDGWAAGLPTPPVINAAVLAGPVAEALAAACPSGALRRESDVLVYDVGACTACGRCLAIQTATGHAVAERSGTERVAEPSGVWDLAATRRADLIKRIPIRGGDR